MRTIIAAAGLVSLVCACSPADEPSDPWRRAPRDDPGPIGLPGEVGSPVDQPPTDEPPADEPPTDEPPPDEPPPDEPPPDEPPPDEPPPDEPPLDEPPAHCAGGPLESPIEGCAPTLAASSDDPHQDCVDRINQFRSECQCLPPLQRWTSGEDCADRMSEADHDSGQAHGAAGDGMCDWGSGQNECPGWGSVDEVIGDCLQMMWDEGPGSFWAHGHYLQMASTEKTHVACGFHDGPNGTWAVQNFY